MLEKTGKDRRKNDSKKKILINLVNQDKIEKKKSRNTLGIFKFFIKIRCYNNKKEEFFISNKVCITKKANEI